MIRLLLISFLFVGISCNKQLKRVNDQPNVLIIQTDDLGFDDLTMRGIPNLQTPNLDMLGEESVQFENFYLQSVCAPSRAAFLTGRNFLKTGVTSVHAGRDYMNLDETTIGDVFQQHGYATGMWGKWHSGKTDGYFPWDRGFDEAYYAALYNYFDNVGLLNGEEFPTPGYTTDEITDMAIDFIERHNDQPFFAYLSHLAPHNPWRAPKEYVDKYLEKGLSEANAQLFGMIDNMDHNIGRVLDAIEAQGLEENTIIVFLSDNGPWLRSYRFGLSEDEWKMRNPSGLKGTKGQLWDNGVKSTLFMKWGSTFTPAKEYRITQIEDLLPTLASLAKIQVSGGLPLDGVDFSEVFYGKEVENSTVYFSHHSPKGFSGSVHANNNMSTPAEPLTGQFKKSILFEDQILGIRKEEWKFIQNQIDGDELYNMEQDDKEENNLIHSHPDKAKELRSELRSWYQQVLSENSYNMPVHQIGYEKRELAHIYACTPSGISDGLINENHYLTGWTQADTSEYSLDVHTPGMYEVYLIHEIPNFEQFTFKVATDESFIEATLSDSGNRNFGTLIEGESAYWDNFDLKETFRESIINSYLGSLELKQDAQKLKLISVGGHDNSETKDHRVIAIRLQRILNN